MARDYICSETGCESKFSRRKRLIIHIRTHSGERPFICTYEGCDKSYARSQHLTRHITKTHEKDSDRSSDESKDVEEDQSPKVVEYKCSYCIRTYPKKRYRNEHQKTHQGIPRPHVCPREGCEAKFPTPDKLKRHIKSHDGHTCHICGAGGFTWSLLRKHKAIDHMKDRQCMVCNRVFSKIYNLKKHVKLHEDPGERHRCPVGTCPRAYTEEKNLRYHIQSYHAKRPFQCDKPDCGKAFKEEPELLKHSRYHDPSVPLPSKSRKKRKRAYSYAAYLAGCIEPVKRQRKKKNQEQNDSVSDEEMEISTENVETPASTSNCDDHEHDGLTENSESAPTINATILSELFASNSEKSSNTLNQHKTNFQLVGELCG